MTEFTFHLIANAHLDPVWLWDWKEGLNEGLITCRTVLDLMDENPDLTFIRGESAIYQHIEQTEPETFARIKRYVRSGRWDVVGGTVIQPDTNLPATETFARHFLHGQRYFIEKFGKPTRVAWAADSFGHAAGLPEILVHAGIEYYACTRPPPSLFPTAKPAFWWEGPGSSRVLTYRPSVGWYGTFRQETPGRLDEYLAEARKFGLHNVACFYGLGNHGGGPTRAMLRQIQEWQAKHPEIRVVHSGLHRFFEALRDELHSKGDGFVPSHRGELNYVLRGCYSSAARFKFPYRQTEAILSRAETTDAVIRAGLTQPPADLASAWDAVLFNSFHDILPGSSIERAYTDQLAWLGTAFHQAQQAELAALNALAARIDTRVNTPTADMPAGLAGLVWNPHPWRFKGHIEFEGALDYRFIDKYYNNVDAVPVQVLGPNRKPLPFQIINNEHASAPKHAWRKRAVIPVDIRPMGWTVLEMAYVENPKLTAPPKTAVKVTASGALNNGIWRVAAKVGASGIQIARKGRKLFGSRGLSAVVFRDPYGSWGDMSEDPHGMKINQVLETWVVKQIQALERGPQRGTVWLRLAGRHSWMDLTISLDQGRDAVDVSARILWNERSSRLKLVMPGGDRAEFEVPGGTIERGPAGEVPGGRWVRVQGKRGGFGFASNALYNFDSSNGDFRATIVRASRYAADEVLPPEADPWRPAFDAGELTFKFIISPGADELPQLAAELERPPIVLLVAPSAGDLPRTGTLFSLSPASMELVAIKPSFDRKGFILRLRETSGRKVRPLIVWQNQKIVLGAVQPYSLTSWRLVSTKTGWQAGAVNIIEE